MDAFGLPKKTDEDKVTRKQAIEEASKYAIEVPFKVMEVSLQSMDLIEAMVKEGNPNSVTDAGVGAICARSAVMGAFLNVKINAAGIEDKAFAEKQIEAGEKIQKVAMEREQSVLAQVNQIISKA